MKYFLVSLVVISACLSSKIKAQSAELVDLYQLVKERKVKLKVRGSGGYQGECISLDIENISAQEQYIKVVPGTIFSSQADWEQDLMVMREEQLLVEARKVQKLPLQTMCIQSSNASPSVGSVFFLSELADKPLLAMAETINEYKYFNSTAQSAVWAVANGNGLHYVYGEDKPMMERLCATIAEATGKPCTEQNYRLRPHEIRSFNTSLEVLIPDYLQAASLKLYTCEGELYHTFWQNEALDPGFYQFKLGVFHTLSDSAQFDLRIEEDSNQIAEKRVAANDTIMQLLPIPASAFVVVRVNKRIKGRVGVYDEEDNLYILLADNHTMNPGTFKMSLNNARDLPPNRQYFLKVKNGDNTVVSQPYFADVTQRKTYPTSTKRGSLKFTLKEDLHDADLVIIDESGSIVWSVFEDSYLRFGSKNVPFVFQHQRGKAANFRWQLLNEKDEVVKQGEI